MPEEVVVYSAMGRRTPELQLQKPSPRAVPECSTTPSKPRVSGLNNRSIARTLGERGDLLELTGENPGIGTAVFAQIQDIGAKGDRRVCRELLVEFPESVSRAARTLPHEVKTVAMSCNGPRVRSLADTERAATKRRIREHVTAALRRSQR